MQSVNTFFQTNLTCFSKNQYGFRPGHSTEYAALELTDRIITDMDKNNVPLYVYIDLSKACDAFNPNTGCIVLPGIMEFEQPLSVSS